MRSLVPSRVRHVSRPWLALGLGLLVSCGSEATAPSDQATTAASALFVVPDSLQPLQGDHWLDHPWPSDFRREADGTVRLDGYRNPRHVPLISLYLEEMRGKLDGFSPTAAGYFRFSAPIDSSSLPSSPADSLSADSAVQLIDVDPDSPEVGTRHPVTVEWHAEPGVYWLEDTLAFMPTLGFPLRPGTTYAVVATSALKSMGGAEVVPSDDLREVLAGGDDGAPTAILAKQWKPAIDQIEKTGIARDKIVELTVFTTTDPTKQTIRVAEDARTRQPAPKVDESSWKLSKKGSDYDIYEGIFGPSPDYQAGTPPFEGAGDGGGFVFDADGWPIKQRSFNPRFALSVPHEDKCPMPADGYPVVMYAHGTGGDYKSFLGVTAQSLAQRCMVTMGVDQIMHGDRLPKVPGKTWNIELLFFNFNNPKAMRTNVRQSAVDEVVRARLLRETGVQVPGSVSATGKPITLSKSTILFFGHSQGGLNGPLFLAVDDTARGGVLSGSASMTTLSLLYKTKPQPSVAGLTKTLLLALHGQEAQEVGPLHPGLALVQIVADVIDPINYVPMLIRRPLPGHHPKSIYQTEGVNPDFTGDNYAPPYGIEVQAIATGLPWMKPVIHQIDQAKLVENGTVEIPAAGLQGNLANGEASGVLAQWPASEASDGHFVVFQVPGAIKQSAQFCRNLVDDPKGLIPAP